MTHLDIYNSSLALNTDRYQLTMAQGYWKDGRQNDKAIFHMFFRNCPFDQEFAISCGQTTLIEYIDNHFEFTSSDFDYLKSLKDGNNNPLFEKDFLHYLDDMEFECTIDMVPEGTIMFPNEPIVKVKGPIIQAQLLETALLNCINYQTLVATKARLLKEAANSKPVLEFGLRRAQGLDGGLSAAKAACVGGADATSNELAGKHLGLPVKGTHAHSWVQSYSSEERAFKSFGESNPGNAVFLVDTYDTVEGVRKAVEVADEEDIDLAGVRLDSGDLCELSKQARQILDDAGYENAKIIASDGLDVDKIQKIEQDGGKIDAYGVGTNLVTCRGNPALGGVYKLGAVKPKGSGWIPKIKVSDTPGKTSIPGDLQVVREYFTKSNGNTKMTKDIIIDEMKDNFQKNDEYGDVFYRRKLLNEVYKEGNKVSDPHIDMDCKCNANKQFKALGKPEKEAKKAYQVQKSSNVIKTQNQLIEKHGE